MTVIVLPTATRPERPPSLWLKWRVPPICVPPAGLPVFEQDYPFEIGKANVLREGKDAAVFACGLMVSETLEAAELLAAEGIHISVITFTPSNPSTPPASRSTHRSAATW